MDLRSTFAAQNDILSKHNMFGPLVEAIAYYMLLLSNPHSLSF